MRHAQFNGTPHCIMNKLIPTLAIVCSLFAVTGFAKTLKLPNDEFSIASINIPDIWEPEEVENGVAAQSPDSAVYLAVVAVGTEKGMNNELEDTFAFLEEHKVELDKSTKQETKFKINDIEAEEITFQGKDEGGPAAVSIAFVPMKDKVLVFTYWVSTEDEEKHTAVVGKILQSLKPAS
jgi:hypothetical protein